MGGAQAKATAIVDAEINAAISALQSTFSANKSTNTSINMINMTGGCKFKVDTLDMSNFTKVNMKAVVESMQDGTFDTAVSEKVAQAADAAAKAGLGIAAANSTAITNSIENISTVISQSISNTIQSQTVSENLFSCGDKDDFDARIFNMGNVTETVTDIVTKSSQVSSVRQSAIMEIAQEVKSKAEGLDPTMLALIGLAILLVVVGVGFVGAGKAVSILLKPSFWMMISLLVGLAGTALALIKLGGDGTWPYKKDDPEHNKTVLTVAGIMAGVGFIGTGITGFIVAKTEGKKKKLAAAASAAKQA